MDIILSLRKSLVLSICFFRGYPYEGEYKSIITLSDYLSQIVILLRSSALMMKVGLLTRRKPFDLNWIQFPLQHHLFVQ